MDKIANCNNCGQGLEFDASMANSLIACPSCGVETKLTEVDYHPEPKLSTKAAYKIDATVGSSKLTRQVGWICSVFGLLTFMSQFIRFVALNVTYKDTWGGNTIPFMSEKNILVGIRIDEVFTHCALGLIIAGFGVFLLELKNIYKK